MASVVLGLVAFSIGVNRCFSFGSPKTALAASMSDQTASPQQPVVAIQSQADVDHTFSANVRTLLDGSCTRCHNPTRQSGALDLQRFTKLSDDAAIKDCVTLEMVTARLESGTMLPKSEPRPPNERLAPAIHRILSACGGSLTPPPTPLNSAALNGDHASVAPGVQTAPTVNVPQEDVFDSVLKPVIRNICGNCHNPTDMAGDLDLTRFLTMSREQALNDRALWENIASKVGARQMPPPSKARLDSHEVSSITSWIQDSYAELDEQSAPSSVRVTTRRLNRHEYNNTVRDLLGVNLNVSADFPPDPYAYGFDNIGDALSLSPALTEMYMKEAQRIARTAIPIGPPLPPVSTKFDAVTNGQRDRMHIQTIYEAPVAAVYNLKAGWDQAVSRGTVMSAHLFLDGHEVAAKTFAFAYSMDRTIYAFKLPMTQGTHKIEALMEVAPDSEQKKPFKGALPYPTWLEVNGPYNEVPFEQTAAFKQIFFKGTPRPASEAAYEREILQRLAYRAYRRPPTKDQLSQLTNLASAVRQHGGNFYKQIQIALEKILMSPEFLFRIEREPSKIAPAKLDDYELASRLSYFLWSSMPDDNLLTVAAKGQLHDPETLHQQVQRMLRDPKANSLAVNFSGEWLQTQNLEFETPDATTFHQFDAALRDDMQTETRMFFNHILSDDRSILEFLDGKYTFLNERLAKFYGIPGVTGSLFRQVSLQGTDRGGILTQASVLTATSYPTRTSPTVRGKWILTNILNTPPPEPPANVPSLASEHAAGKPMSIRDRLSLHRANPVCASCHSGMDPLGFALEHYDAIGEWRESADGLPIDASGKLPDGTEFTGASELQAVLMRQSDKFVDCLTEKLLTYSLGRGLMQSDRPTVRRIERRVTDSHYRFSALVYAIVDSPAFQMIGPQRIETSQNSPKTTPNEIVSAQHSKVGSQ